MIASVSGLVTALAPDGAVVEVGGVGLLVQCTPATLARLRLGERAALSTALVVRETELTLYGFADADEREVFEALQTAAGVGPRLAQAVLATHSPDVVRRAVATEDLTTLTRVPGIGRKGAQRIVLDLKDRLGGPTGAAPVPAGAAPDPLVPVGGWREQVRTGLVGLGFSAAEAEAAVAQVARGVAAGPQAGDAQAGDVQPGDAQPGDVQAGDVRPGDVAGLLRQALAVLRPS